MPSRCFPTGPSEIPRGRESGVVTDAGMAVFHQNGPLKWGFTKRTPPSKGKVRGKRERPSWGLLGRPLLRESPGEAVREVRRAPPDRGRLGVVRLLSGRRDRPPACRGGQR